METYRDLYENTIYQISEKGYCEHKNLLEIITSKENILNALRSISKNQGGRTPGH